MRDESTVIVDGVTRCGYCGEPAARVERTTCRLGMGLGMDGVESYNERVIPCGHERLDVPV